MKKRIKIILSIIFVVILIVYFGYYFYINYKNSGDIAILSYHHFMTEKEKEKYAPNNYNVISTEKFEEQLKYLKNNKYESITPEQLKCYLEKKCKIPKKAFMITIDDGNISTYYKALPLLRKYNFDSIAFVITSRMYEFTEDWNPSNYNFLGKDKIDEINNSKIMRIGSHSDSLHDLIDGKNPIDVKSYNEIVSDVKKSKEILKTNIYAYPFGIQNEKYVSALKEAGYEMAFTYKDYRMVKQDDNMLKIPRIEVRGDYSLNDFKNALKAKISLLRYTKNLIRKIIKR